MKNWFAILLILLSTLQAYALEDLVVFTNGKITDIKVQNKDIISVEPLVTITNDKNTLFVNALKTGETQISLLKESVETVKLNVKVTDKKTVIDSISGFSVISLDMPPVILELDLPPELNFEKEI